jgi:hypothetical protein
LYLSLHGNKNQIVTGSSSEFRIPLDVLSKVMGKKYKGVGVHFASCAVMKSDMEEFINSTGVSFVSGYSKYVYFDDSSIMDLSMLMAWFWSTYNKPMFRKLEQDFPELIKRNGFEYILKP